MREAPGHVQPELAEKTVPPLGECPPPERSRPPGPHRRQPAPGPSPSPPRGRAPVAPGKLAPRAREGLGPTPGRATVPPGTWTLNAIVLGTEGEPFSFPLLLRNMGTPAQKTGPGTGFWASQLPSSREPWLSPGQPPGGPRNSRERKGLAFVS